jgi:hypothetical protein
MSSLLLELRSKTFALNEFHRFEGMSNTDDNSIIFPISANDRIKATWSMGLEFMQTVLPDP